MPATAARGTGWSFSRRAARKRPFSRGAASEEEAESYREELMKVLSFIEDKAILQQRSLSVEQKIFLLQQNHPDIVPKAVFHYTDKKLMLSFNGEVLYDYNRFQFKINFIKLKEKFVEVEGNYLIPLTALGIPRLYALTDEDRFLAEDNDYDEIVYSVDQPIAVRKGYVIRIPLEAADSSVKFLQEYDAFEVEPKNIIMGKHCPITYKLGKSYYYKNGYMLLPTRTGFRMIHASRKDAAKRKPHC